MQSEALAYVCAEVGEMVTLYRYLYGVPCPCTSATGSYSRDWHRAHPDAEDCEGRGVIGATVSPATVKCIYQPVYMLGYALRDYVDVTQIAELFASDIIVWVAAYSLGSAGTVLVVWSVVQHSELEIKGTRYRLVHILPTPLNEIAIFRPVSP